MDNSDDSGHSYRGGRGDVGDDNSNVDDEDGDDNDNNVVVYVRDFKFFFSSVILSVIDQILAFLHIPVSDCLQM